MVVFVSVLVQRYAEACSGIPDLLRTCRDLGRAHAYKIPPTHPRGP